MSYPVRSRAHPRHHSNQHERTARRSRAVGEESDLSGANVVLINPDGSFKKTRGSNDSSRTSRSTNRASRASRVSHPTNRPSSGSTRSSNRGRDTLSSSPWLQNEMGSLSPGALPDQGASGRDRIYYENDDDLDLGLCCWKNNRRDGRRSHRSNASRSIDHGLLNLQFRHSSHASEVYNTLFDHEF